VNQWAGGRARLAHAAVPAAAAAFGVALAVHDGDPVLLLPAAGFAAFAARCASILLRLDPEAVVVRNPLRTYRVPYGSVSMVDETWWEFVGKGKRHVVGSPVLRLRVDGRWTPVEVRATAFLPRRERQSARARLTDLVRAARLAGDREGADLDMRPPYDAALDLLVAADPDGLVRPDLAVLYTQDASDVAAILRERPLTGEDLGDLWDDPPAGLLARLNALRGPR